MQHGFAVRNGLFAALMAAGGYTGIKRVFEREYGGYLAVFGEGHEPLVGEIARDLGTRWETHGIVLKPYAAMGALHSPLDGIFEITKDRKLDPNQIARVDIELAHAAYHHGWWVLERPITPIAAQMNVAYSVAVAILDRQAMVHQFSPRRIESDDVWELIPKITAHHNVEFDKGGKLAKSNMRMTVHLKDGTTLSSFIGITKTVVEPMDRTRAIAKFMTLTNGVIDTERQARIIDCLTGLECLDNVQTLSALLAPAVNAAF